MKGHLIASQKTEAFLGWAVFLAGAFLLKDAYDRRGRDQPWWGKPFTFL